ncbi:MAG: gliding motility-associated C-terminal domain-containing protein [Cytophagales bacterium]|nr:gliding motility-associated C-terminal domain-containing protein [Cytophagales bacterium]
MLKKLYIFIAITLSLLTVTHTYATHVVGGVLEYVRIGPGSLPNSSRYKVVLKLWRDAAGNPWFPPSALIEVRGDTLPINPLTATLPGGSFDPYVTTYPGGTTYPYGGINRMVSGTNSNAPQFKRDFTITWGGAQAALDTFMIRSGALSATAQNGNTRLFPSTNVPSYENPSWNRALKTYPTVQYNRDGYGFVKGVFNTVSGEVLSANGDRTNFTDACVGGRLCVEQYVNTCTFAPKVAIQWAEYIRVVDLPNIPGGYHMTFRLCCRNNALQNLNNPGSTSYAVYARIPDVARLDNATNTWQQLYTTLGININTTLGFNNNTTTGVSIVSGSSVTMGNYTSPGTGKSLVQMVRNSSPRFRSVPPLFVCSYNQFIEDVLGVQQNPAYDHGANDLDADSVQYEVVNAYDEQGPFTDTWGGLPATNINGTLFSGNMRLFATTLPGFPYPDNVNLATYRYAQYRSPYTPTNPLSNSASWQGIILNTSTGTMQIRPQVNVQGLYVVAIRAREFRKMNDGTLRFLGEVTRDYQFRVLNCPAPAIAAIGNSDQCNGTNTVNLVNNNINGISNFYWDTGRDRYTNTLAGVNNLRRRTDNTVNDFPLAANTTTATLPSFNFQNPGTYYVKLVIQRGTKCADSVYRPVNVTSVRAGWGQNPSGQVCVNNGVLFDPFMSSSVVGITTVSGSSTWTNPATNPIPTRRVSVTGVGFVNKMFKWMKPNGSLPVEGDTMQINNYPLPQPARVQRVVWNFGDNVQQIFSFSGSSLQPFGCIVGATSTLGLGIVCANTTVVAFNPAHVASVPGVRHAYTSSGSYVGSMTVWNQFGCQSSLTRSVVVIQNRPSATALGGPVCLNNPLITIPGTVSSAVGGIWSQTPLTGTFLSPISAVGPNLSMIYRLNTTVSPNLTVNLALSTYGNGACPTGVISNVGIGVLAAPAVDAGNNATICRNNRNYRVTGSITGLTNTGFWRTKGTGTFENGLTTISTSHLNAHTYTLSLADSTAGSVQLVLQSTNNNVCTAVKDSITLTLGPTSSIPTVNVGPDRQVGSNNTILTVTGVTYTNSPGIQWQAIPATGGTFTPIGTTTSTTMVYVPSAADIISTTVTLRAMTTIITTNGSCLNVFDDLKLTILPCPVVTIRVTNPTPCTNKAIVTVTGTFTGAGGAVWSGGLGTYLPSAISPNLETIAVGVQKTTLIYLPTQAEIDALIQNLTLTTTINGLCNPVSAVSENIVYQPAPILSIVGAPSISLCKNNSNVSLDFNGYKKLLGTLIPINFPDANITLDWSSTGRTSSLSPVNGKPTTYTAGTDTSLGAVRIFLTATQTNCLPVYDTLNVSFNNNPSLSAGPSQTVCDNNLVVSLSGSVTAPATGGRWRTSGTGIFQSTGTNESTLLNDIYIPNAANGTVTLTLSTTGASIGNGVGQCRVQTTFMNVSISPAPNVRFATVPTICENVASTAGISLSATISGSNVTSSTQGTWVSGAGTYSPGNSNFVISPDPINGGLMSASSIIYTPSTSELSAKTFALNVTASGLGNCISVNNTLVVTIAGKPLAKILTTNGPVCANNATINLTATISGATGQVWSGPVNSVTGGLSASYTPNTTEINSGRVVFRLQTLGELNNCNPEFDVATVNINLAPVVGTGGNIIACINDNVITITGNISSPATSGLWTTSGSGFFGASGSSSTLSLPVTDMTSVYRPSALDKSSALPIKLTLTSQGNGNCNPVFDIMNLSFAQTTTANAGSGYTICVNDFPINLNASGSAGSWQTAPGTFGSSGTSTSTQLVDTFTPNSTLPGIVSLTWRTNSTNQCPAVQSTVTFTVLSAPTVNTGGNITVCGTNRNVPLAGISSSGSGTWASGGFGNFTSTGASFSTGLNDVYVLHNNDILAGQVVLTLSSTNTNPCSQVRATKIIFITPPISSDAGPDQLFCVTQNVITVTGGVLANGSPVSVPTGYWMRHTTATGLFAAGVQTFIGNNTTYTLGLLDIQQAPLVLRFKANSFGACTAPAEDTVKYTFQRSPFGFIQSVSGAVCSDTAYISILASFTGAGGMEWLTTGTGTFFPDRFTANARYVPTAADVSRGFVDFSIRLLGSGVCNGATFGYTTVGISPKPSVSAGSDENICSNIGTVNLTGARVLNTVNNTPPTAVLWYTSNVSSLTGFSSNTNFSFTGFSTNSGASPTYTLSSNDLTNGSVTLYISVTGPGACRAQTARKILTIYDAPVVSVGSASETYCGDVASLTISGTTTYGTPIWQIHPTATGFGTLTSIAGGTKAAFVPVTTLGASMPLSVIFNFVVTTSTCNNVIGSKTIFLTTIPNVSITGGLTSICGDVLGQVTGLSAFSRTGAGLWSSTAPGGFFANNAVLSSGTFVPVQSFKDANHGRTFWITFTSDNNGICTARRDHREVLILTPPSITGAGLTDETYCTDINTLTLSNITITNASGYLIYSSGQGLFTASSANTLAGATPFTNQIYTPATVEKFAGTTIFTLSTTGVGSCAAISKQKAITYVREPGVFAGGDQTICASTSSFQLSASVSGFAGITWTTSGTGSFDNINILGPRYFWSKQDSINARNGVLVTITATVVGNSLCQPKTSRLRLNITPRPLITVTGPIEVCADTSGFPVRAILSLSNTGVNWVNISSTAPGSFFANAFNTTVTYVPSPDDISRRSVILLASTTGNGSCTPASNTITINIRPIPSITFTDYVVCKDVGNYIPLSFTGVTGSYVKQPISLGQHDVNNDLVTWASSGNGTFIDSAVVQVNELYSSNYQVTQEDKDLGKITLLAKLRSFDNLCKAVQSRINVTFIGTPIVNAGVDKSYCRTVGTVQLSGSVTGPETYKYYYKSHLAYHGRYASSNIIDSSLIQNVSVSTVQENFILNNDAFGEQKIILVASASGICKATYTDTLSLNIKAPINLTFSGTSSSIICSDSTYFDIVLHDTKPLGSGDSSTAQYPGYGVAWSARNALGVDASFSQFSPGVFAKRKLTYFPSTSDYQSGAVTFTYTTSGNGICPADSKSSTVAIRQAPDISTLAGLTYCSNNSTIVLTAQISNLTSVSPIVKWYSGGGFPGTFTSTNMSVGTATAPNFSNTYLPSTNQINDGNANLFVEIADANNLCKTKTQSQKVVIKKAPVVDPGVSGSVCSLSGLLLNGSVETNYTTTGASWSIVSGSPILSPTTTTLAVSSTLGTPNYVTSKANVTFSGAIFPTFRLTATETGCINVSADITYGYSATPQYPTIAGGNFCGSDGISLTVAGAIGNDIWSTTATGFFASTKTNTSSKLNDKYIPATGFVGAIHFVLTPNIGSLCGTPAGLNVAHTVSSGMAVNPGNKKIVAVCTNFEPLMIGTISGSNIGIWNSNGTGVFSIPGAEGKPLSTSGTALGGGNREISAIYRPTAADKSSGSVILTLSTSIDGTNICTIPVRDTVSIVFLPAPSTNGQGDKGLCTNVVISTAPGSGITFIGSAFLPSPNSLDPTLTPANGAQWKYANPGTSPGYFLSSGATTSVSDTTTTTLFGITLGMQPQVFIASPQDTARVMVEGTPLIFTLETVNNRNCNPAVSTVQISFAQSPSAYITTTLTSLCADLTEINLEGHIGVALDGVWSTTGAGSFNPDNIYTNTPKTYQLSTSETAILTPQNIYFNLQSTGNGPCRPVTSSVLTVTINPKPALDPGTDQTVCGDISQITLTGINTVSSAIVSAYRWYGGKGTISGMTAPATAMPAFYALNQLDEDFREAILTISTSGPGSCKPLSKNIKITVNPKPAIKASPSQELCNDLDIAFASANITNGLPAQWLAIRYNAGVATPAAGTISVLSTSTSSFVPGGTDAVADSIGIIAITSSTGCNIYRDTINIKLLPRPTVSVSTLAGQCADINSIPLNVTITNALGMTWGRNDKADADLDYATSRYISNPTYFLTQADKSVPFTTTIGFNVSTTGNGTCKTYMATVTVQLVPLPVVTTLGVSKCADISTFNLTDFVPFRQHTTGINWLSFGSGTLTGLAGSATDPTQWVYTPSQNDKNVGAVNFQLYSTGPTPCNTVSSFVTLRFDATPQVTVSAGLDQIVCADNQLVNLNGVIVNHTLGSQRWNAFKPSTITGNLMPPANGVAANVRGSFSDATDVNASYTPSSADTVGTNASGVYIAQTIMLLLTVNGTGACANQIYSDEMNVSFTGVPRISPVINIFPASLCGNETRPITLSGTFINDIGKQAVWKTTGDNGISPSASVNNPPTVTGISYVLSAQDKTRGNIGFTFEITGKGTCKGSYKVDTLMTISPTPTLQVTNQTACDDIAGAVTFTGITSGVNQARWFTGTWAGQGSLSPAGVQGVVANKVSVAYTPSAADKAMGKIRLQLASAATTNSCPLDTIFADLKFDKAPVVNAGLDRNICADISNITLTSSLQNHRNAIWQAGASATGSYSPSAAGTAIGYNLSAADKELSRLTFTVTSSDLNSVCAAATDEVIVSITGTPYASIGTIDVCSYNAYRMVGTVNGNALESVWTVLGTGGGTFSPSRFDINARYFPTQAELNSGKIQIGLIAVGKNTCGPYTTSKQLNVSPNPFPIIDAGRDQKLCVGRIFEVEAVNPKKEYTFQWYASSATNPNTIAGFDVLSARLTVPAATSNYILKATNKKLGCITYDTVSVIPVTPVDLRLVPKVCFNDTLIIAKTTANSRVIFTDGTYQWYRDGSFLPGETDPNMLKAVVPGNYILEYQEYGCVSTDTTNIKPLPILSTAGIVICRGSEVELKPNVISVTGLDNTKFSISWAQEYNYANNGMNRADSVALKALASYRATENRVSAKYLIQAVDLSDNLGCNSYDTIRVKTHPLPQMQLKDNPACEGDVVSLDARPITVTSPIVFNYYPSLRSDTARVMYKWTTSSTVPLTPPKDTAHALSLTYSKDKDMSGTYIATFSIGNPNDGFRNTCTQKDTSKVMFNKKPDVENVDKLTYCIDDRNGITLDAGTSTKDTLSYLWMSSGSTNRQVMVYDTLMYYFKVFNTKGCSVLDSIHVKASCKPLVFKPDAFIPGGSQGEANKYFIVKGKYFKDFRIVIYNRWGEVIFAYEGASEDFAWDGNYKGQPMPVGVYPYIIHYKGKYGEYAEERQERGAITLIR